MTLLDATRRRDRGLRLYLILWFVFDCADISAIDGPVTITSNLNLHQIVGFNGKILERTTKDTRALEPVLPFVDKSSSVVQTRNYSMALALPLLGVAMVEDFNSNLFYSCCGWLMQTSKPSTALLPLHRISTYTKSGVLRVRFLAMCTRLFARCVLKHARKNAYTRQESSSRLLPNPLQ